MKAGDRMFFVRPDLEVAQVTITKVYQGAYAVQTQFDGGTTFLADFKRCQPTKAKAIGAALEETKRRARLRAIGGLDASSDLALCFSVAKLSKMLAAELQSAGGAQ